MTNWLSKNRQTIARSLAGLLAIILLVGLLKEESGDEIASALKRVSIWYFLGGMLAMLISRLFVASRWHVLLRSVGIDIIIAEEQKFTQQKKGSFIEENNAWV